MSYRKTREQQSETVEAQPISYRCPAHGCPNAASTSFDGARWACYFHASALAEKWPEVTTEILQGWPRTCNWNHPDKIAYDAEQAAKRRAKLPPRRGHIGMDGLQDFVA
jgi:hypothetical protein